ncbi:MAG: hypothetical protein ACRDHE_15020, partial [Ktedonobacterales bacterium]
FWKFILFTLLGSLPWTFLLAYIGYRLGDKIQNATQLTTVFHGLDIVILVVVVALVALYVYRHVQKDRAAERETSGEAVHR